jgi:hypothetical protein
LVTPLTLTPASFGSAVHDFGSMKRARRRRAAKAMAQVVSALIGSPPDRLSSVA